MITDTPAEQGVLATTTQESSSLYFFFYIVFLSVFTYWPPRNILSVVKNVT